MFKVAGPLWAQAAVGGDNVFARLVKTGKKVLRRVLQKTEREPTVVHRKIPKPTWSLQTIQISESSTARLIGGLFPKQLLNTQAAEARRRAALRLIRDSRKVPVFAFVGLSLGASLERKQNGQGQEDVLCSGIRDLFQQHGVKQSVVDDAGQQFSLETLQLGHLIGKGCNAAVYEARPVSYCSDEERCAVESRLNASIPTPVPELTSDDAGSSVDPTGDDLPPTVFRTDDSNFISDDTDEDFVIISGDEDDTKEFGTDISSSTTSLDCDGWMMYRVSANPEGVVDSSDADSDIFILAGDEDGLESVPDAEDMGLDWLKVGTMDGAGCAAEADPSRVSDTTGSMELSTSYSLLSLGSTDTNATTDDPEPAPNFSGYVGAVDADYPLAVKMMFNYSVESHTDRIMSAMAKETVPAPTSFTDQGVALSSLQFGVRKLPPHPNIVAMHGVFVDNTPELPGAAEVYPAALPLRLNSEGGLGRNATMFLVMKKYTMTLREYLAVNTPNTRTRCLLLAQLLEGVLHLGSHGVAHRDLKSDNLLIDLSHGTDKPFLVISDFGCCLADETFGLTLPYTTRDMDRGGNCSLMAPEIKCAEPGRGIVLDYTKADLWAAGALAYEIFGEPNPFYHQLDARTYSEDNLPNLYDDVPKGVQELIRLMLKRDPNQRPTPSAAATMMHLFLWAPSNMQPFPSQHSSASNALWKMRELSHWLEQITIETVCLRVFGSRASLLELVVRTTFLSRVSHSDIAAVVALENTL